jgi:hypothetical protein
LSSSFPSIYSPIINGRRPEPVKGIERQFHCKWQRPENRNLLREGG